MTKRKNVVEKFQKFFGRLNEEEEEQLMILMSAFRGPDDRGIHSIGLKENTTARIRTLLLGLKLDKNILALIDEDFFFCGRLVSFKSVDIDRWVTILKDKSDESSKVAHYCSHTKDALLILKELGLK